MRPHRLLHELAREGWTIRPGKKHWVAQRDGRTVVVSHTLPEADRHMQNLRAQLRRAGFVGVP